MEATSFSNALDAVGIEAWAGQAILVALVTLVAVVLVRRALGRLARRLEATPGVLDESAVEALSGPVTLLLLVVGLGFALRIVEAAVAAPIFAAVEPIRDTGVVVSLAWFAVSFASRTKQRLIARREAQGRPFDRSTYDAVVRLAQLGIAIIGVLITLQTLGISVSGLLAFGGIGGIAVGFAAKDLLANFFGGLMIYWDRPFAVGDWIKSPDRNLEGTVEHIGWRVTRLRTFDSQPLYVPNSLFANIAVQNPARMENRRIYETVGIRYDDADKMAAVVGDVKAMLLAHPGIDADRTVMVSFTRFAPSSMDFFIYCFTRTRVWAEYNEVKQDVLLRTLDVIQGHGAEVAFPTSTVHLERGH